LRTAAQDHSRCLRVLDTVTEFRRRLQDNADGLHIIARRKIIRLLVKEILVGAENISSGIRFRWETRRLIPRTQRYQGCRAGVLKERRPEQT